LARTPRSSSSASPLGVSRFSPLLPGKLGRTEAFDLIFSLSAANTSAMPAPMPRAAAITMAVLSFNADALV